MQAFVDRVQNDDADVLVRLKNEGYFSEDKVVKNKDSGKSSRAQVYSGVNILIASACSSALISLFITPLDLVYYHQHCSPNKSMSTTQAVTELAAKPGRALMVSMCGVSTFIRYLFVLSAFNLVLNHSKK